MGLHAFGGKKEAPVSKQQVWMGPEVSSGVRSGVIRRESGDLEAGVLVTPEKKRTLNPGDEYIVSEDAPGEWCDAETVYRCPRESGGPPQVATPAYREGYDRIFGKKTEVGIA